MNFGLEYLKEKSKRNPEAWIGVDLDKTLAYFDEWKGWKHIGAPIPKMVERVKKWRALGIKVKILTARCSAVSIAFNANEGATQEKMRDLIQDWCEKYIGERLPVVTEKDMNLLLAADDSIVQMKPNTGEPLAGDAGFEIFKDRIIEAADPEKLKGADNVPPSKFAVGDRIKLPENIRDLDRGKHGVIVKVERIQDNGDDYWLCWFKIDGSDTVRGYRDYCFLPE